MPNKKNNEKIKPILSDDKKEVKFVIPNPRHLGEGKYLTVSEQIDFFTKTLHIAKEKLECDSCNLKTFFATGFDGIPIFLGYQKGE
jgi:ABC-type sulfate transport system substrate-binding protein